MINGSDLGNTMRALSCMGLVEFVNTFGSDKAENLYSKLHDEYDGNWIKFICYLDGDNLNLLTQYTNTRI